MQVNARVWWLSSQGPQCCALSEVAYGESTHTVAPRVVWCQEHGVIWQGNASMQHHAFLCTWHVPQNLPVSVTLAILAYFLQIFPQLKNFFQKSKCTHHPHTRCHLCAKFDVLRPSQSWDIGWRKKQSPTQTPTQLISTYMNLSALHWRKTNIIIIILFESGNIQTNTQTHRHTDRQTE